MVGDLSAALAALPVVDALRLDSVMAGLVTLIGGAFDQRQPTEPAAVVLVRRFIDEHLDEPVQLERLEREVNLTRFHLCRLFKEWSGQTLTEYMTQQRVRKAQALLGNPVIGISEVAMAAGFGSMARFYCAFKGATALTPQEFRRRLVVGADENKA
jgi:AraC family transcriptional regulator